MKDKGMVLRLERFAIHDGPGIRTVVFLKGCPLRCLWCSTVDSQLMHPEPEYYAEKCTGCRRCVEACVAKAISVTSDGKVATDRRICAFCGKCVEQCPAGARKMAGVEMTVDQVMKEVEKDSVFYASSGGGVTLSGGEATMQPGFTMEIIRRCKERGIHTCMETCGYAKWPVFDAIIQLLDMVYVDLKHISPVEHKRLTGRSNRLILDNVRKACVKYPGKQLIIRIPVIPGCNDSSENIAGTAEFVSRLSGEHRIELLPYHRLGTHKYEVLSRHYPLGDLQTPSETHMAALEDLIKSYGVQVKIGG